MSEANAMKIVFNLAIVLCVLTAFCLPTTLIAAEVPLRERAVDLLLLKDGTRLFGVLLSAERAKEVRFLVRGAWLQQNSPTLLAEIQRLAVAPAPVAAEVSVGISGLLAAHIAKLQQDPSVSAEQIGFLQEQLDRQIPAEQPVVDVAVPDAVVVRFPSSLVRRQLRQNDKVRRLAGLAILNQVDDCERLSQSDVQAELQKIPVSQLRQDLPGEATAMSENGMAETDPAKAKLARILLNADRIFGKTCHLIFQSGQYLQDGQQSPADLQQLAGQMLQGQLQSQLQELLGEGFGPPGGLSTSQKNIKQKPGDILNASAAAIADRDNADVVELIQMQMNPTAGSAVVHIDVYHRHPDDNDWKLVVQATGSATSADISEAQRQRIANDPQVQQITQLFSGLGSGVTDLTKAISIGACVETAQTRAAEKLTDALKVAVPGGNVSATGFSVVEAALSELPVAAALPVGAANVE